MSPTSAIAAEAAARAGRRARVRSNVAIIIPSFNEEINLPVAIQSVINWADEVFVVDSESTDGTHDIVRSSGASLVVQPWLGYARQKNWALENLPIKSEWVFILDSDESITPELRDEILALTAGQPAGQSPFAGYYVNRLTYFLGRPIRHCGYFPTYNLRLFRRGKARYEEREVHEHMIVDGPTGRLRNIMLHEDRRGLEHFIAKHNRYSTLEARELTRERVLGRSDTTGPLERGIAARRWLKRHVLPRLPVSGVWRFVYMYFLRLGILDGITGFRFCVVLAMYDMFISLKMAELRRVGLATANEPTPAPAMGLAVPEGATAPMPLSRYAAVKQDRRETPAFNGVVGGVAAPIAPPPPLISRPAPDEVVAVRRLGPELEPLRPQAETLAATLNVGRMPPGDWPALASVPVSILVPVKNEKRNIVECLRRCQWATELIVVDSQSTDESIELAQAMGADVYQFHYDRSSGWPKKKNWALEHVPWKNEWVMILDADEYMTPELADEIKRVVDGSWKPDGKFAMAGCGDGFWVNRRFMFFGRWIKGCGYYPSWNVRLLKHKIGRYERIGTLGDTGSGDNEVHEHIVLSTGKAGYLSNEFLHYAYPDLSAWIEKHNRYTTWEAHAMEAKDKGAVRASFFGEPIERRRWIKAFARHLPFRPWLRFMYSYVLQRGFLDGYPGYVMCRLLSWYEFVSIAKYREMLALRSEAARKDAMDQSGKPR